MNSNKENKKVKYVSKYFILAGILLLLINKKILIF